MLRRSRQVGLNGIGFIPFSEIKSYSEWLGLDCPVEKNRFLQMMVAMDATEVEAQNG